MPHYLESPELEQEKKRAKANQLVGILFLLTVFILIPLFSSGEDADGLLAWENSALIITMPDSQVFTVPYSSIQSITLVEHPDFGNRVSGEQGKHIWWGTWENNSLGIYTLCTYKSFDAVVQVRTEAAIYWIGYESTETTAILYRSFLDHWTETIQ